MSDKYDLIVRGGTLVDPANGREGAFDVAVKDGQIAAVAAGLDPTLARECFDFTGCYVVPGLIDLHIHASAWLGGKFAHKMLARAGVTTALDMSGPIDSVLAFTASHGAGLALASIQYVRPGHTVKNEDPDEAELTDLLAGCLEKGAFGFKLLGGHYPLSPAATARAIAVANRHQAYVAFHAGSLAASSNIDGFLEAVRLADGNALHIAHINSYCRGAVRPYMAETEEAIAALVANPNIRSEAYLSPVNGTSAKCAGGTPESLVTRKCLATGGFAPTEAGLEQAILAGWAQINMESGGEVILATGEEALAYWRAKGTDTTVGFNVNPPEPRLRLATAKRPDGRFVVDCISTDGGGIPRNVIADMGLALVKLQALTMNEFVRKASCNPARILGLPAKGHLGEGADADITVLDLATQRPVLAVAGGQVIMHKGYVCGRGGAIITTAAGAKAVKAQGLRTIVADLAGSAFYTGAL